VEDKANQTFTMCCLRQWAEATYWTTQRCLQVIIIRVTMWWERIPQLEVYFSSVIERNY